MAQNRPLFENSKELVEYLKKNKYLDDMAEAADKFVNKLKIFYEKNAYSLCRHVMLVDLIDLLDQGADSGTKIIEEPKLFENFCADLLYACASELCNNSGIFLMRSQFDVTVRFTTYPICVLSERNKSHNGIIARKGIVMSVSKPENYIIHSVWFCPEECQGSEVIFKSLPKISLKCQVCRSLLFEGSNWRICGERVTVAVKTDIYDICLNVTVKDDLISTIKTGEELLFICTFENKSLNAFYVDKCTFADNNINKRIPRNIQKVFNKSDGVPWKFTYALASSIGFDVCPAEAFMHLKICLLLSLVSIQNSKESKGGILHILIATIDTPCVTRIMEDAAQLGNRYNILGPNDCTNFKETLIASSGGVTLLPYSYSVYSNKTVQRIVQALEKGVIQHEVEELPVNSAIWCQGADTKKASIIDFAGVFGFVSIGDMGDSDELLMELILQTERDVNLENLLSKARNDLKQYIEMARCKRIVKIDLNAEKLITNFFMAARVNTSVKTRARAVDTLISLSCCSARLCMREICNTDDVSFAIWLHIYGTPKPRYAPDELMATPDNVDELHTMMEAFKNWLHSFIDTSLSI